MPVALHNVGSLVLIFANAHLGSATHNFYGSESQLGETGYIEPMAATNPRRIWSKENNIGAKTRPIKLRMHRSAGCSKLPALTSRNPLGIL